MRRLWKKDEKENKKLTVDDFYGNGLKNFMGRHLRIGTNPWSHSVQAKALPDGKGFLIRLRRSLIYQLIDLDYRKPHLTSFLFSYYPCHRTIPIATERFKYEDYWGYEIDILKELSVILNFTFAIENDPEGRKILNEAFYDQELIIYTNQN